jgi:hypothetical protein
LVTLLTLVTLVTLLTMLNALLILWETSGDGVELATLAFLAVFNVLIKLFFSIDMFFSVRSLV